MISILNCNQNLQKLAGQNAATKFASALRTLIGQCSQPKATVKATGKPKATRQAALGLRMVYAGGGLVLSRECAWSALGPRLGCALLLSLTDRG